MQNKILMLSLLGVGLFNHQMINAHSHTYVVEAAPVVVVQQPVVMMQPAPAVVVETPASPMYVESEPPAEMVEQMEPCPGDGYLWIKGNWRWEGRWVWNRGHWHHRPSDAAVYEPGYWKQSHHHHWEYVEGRWR